MARWREIPYTETEEDERELRILQRRVGADAVDLYPHYHHKRSICENCHADLGLAFCLEVQDTPGYVQDKVLSCFHCGSQRLFSSVDEPVNLFTDLWSRS